MSCSVPFKTDPGGENRENQSSNYRLSLENGEYAVFEVFARIQMEPPQIWSNTQSVKPGPH